MYLHVIIFVLLSAKVECNLDINGHRGSNCAWSSWGYWSHCSNDCGSGTQTRHRQCQCGLLAGACEGEAEETRRCESNSGCIHGACRFEEWSEWSECSESCNGLRYRKQVCHCGMEVFNDSYCRGLPIEETEVCNSEANTVGCCNWQWINNWSNANLTCCPSEGTIWRRQACMCTERGLSPDTYCSNRGPFKQQRKKCVNSPACPAPSPSTPPCHWLPPWSEWSPCSSVGNEGIRYRVKQCSCGDPQLCPYPAPLALEQCVARSTNGEWAEGNVTTLCDATCGVGAYWVGSSCVCGDTFCGIHNCVGVPYTHRQKCEGTDCPRSCEWEVNVSPCEPKQKEEEKEEWDRSQMDDQKRKAERAAYDQLYSRWYEDEGEDGEDREEVKEEKEEQERNLYSFWFDDELGEEGSNVDKEDVAMLDEMERKYLEEKKSVIKKHMNYVQKITRRCLCGGVVSNNEYCSPALDVYEEKPCNQDKEEEPCDFSEWSSWSDCHSGGLEGRQTRTRKCPCQSKRTCKGGDIEERPCIEHKQQETKVLPSKSTTSQYKQSMQPRRQSADIPSTESDTAGTIETSTQNGRNTPVVLFLMCTLLVLAMVVVMYRRFQKRSKSTYVLVY